MTTIRYSQQELVKLRESSLVRKPEALPSIEKWVEYGSCWILGCVYFVNEHTSSTEPNRKKGRVSTSAAPEAQETHVDRAVEPTKHSTKSHSKKNAVVILGEPFR